MQNTWDKRIKSTYICTIEMYNKNKEQNTVQKIPYCTREEATGLTELYNPNNEMYINEINNSKIVDDKMIGCAAIILVGLCYNEEKNYLSYGLNLLKKILK